MFRAYRYSEDYAGLVGRDLTPGFKLEEARTDDVDGKAGPMNREKWAHTLAQAERLGQRFRGGHAVVAFAREEVRHHDLR